MLIQLSTPLGRVQTSMLFTPYHSVSCKKPLREIGCRDFAFLFPFYYKIMYLENISSLCEIELFTLQIDILVNNSGRSQRGLVLDTPGVEVDKAMMTINVLGQISLTKVVLPHMIKQKTGQIIVTSSVAGKVGM